MIESLPTHNKNNRDYLNNGYSNDNEGSRSQTQDRSHDDNSQKPLAKLLIVDDDPDIVQVLKLGLLKNRFIGRGIYQARRGITKLQIQCSELLFGALRHEDAWIIRNATSKKSQTG